MWIQECSNWLLGDRNYSKKNFKKKTWSKLQSVHVQMNKFDSPETLCNANETLIFI